MVMMSPLILTVLVHWLGVTVSIQSPGHQKKQDNNDMKSVSKEGCFNTALVNWNRVDVTISLPGLTGCPSHGG